jgi:undecaprenyl-diphosphatase
MEALVTALDRIGSVTKRPPVWPVVAAGLVATNGQRGRDAALRGGVAYGVAAVLANVAIKPIVHRRRPRRSGQARIGPLTSSFPSGHAATDLAFVFGVSQRMPALFLPRAGCTFAAHWSLVRSRAHHLTDILAGGALGIGVAVTVGALWPHSDNPDGSGTGKDDDGDRLMTRIDGEEARLLVHIEPVDAGSGDTTDRSPSGGPSPSPPPAMPE